MKNDMCAKMTECSMWMISAWQEMAEANMNACEKLFKSQMEMAEALCDVITMNGEEIAQTKDVKDIASLQAEIAEVTGKLMIENAQSAASILADCGKTYTRICEEAMKTGSSFAKPANASAKGKKAA